MTLRLGMLSAAHPHANAYARGLAGIEDATLVGIADDDADRAHAFASTHEVNVLSSTELLATVDAAIVCAQNVRHRAWVEQAAAAGVHVLCEKPLATTVTDADAMIEACADAGVHLGAAMPVRFVEPIRRAKAAVDAGDLGEIQAIVGTNLLRWMAADSWFTDPERSGGGAIMDHVVHVVDLVRWLTGEEVAEVYAESGTLFQELAVEDTAVLSMELTDGTPVTHDGSWRQPDTWRTWGDVTLRLIGTEQVLEVDCFDQTLVRTTADDGMSSVYWGEDMDTALVAAFVDAIRTDRAPAITGEDGVREVAVVAAAYASVDAGEPVPVSYP